MFMKIGNDKETFVRPTELLDINAGLDIVDFTTKTCYLKVILTTADGLQITCKAQDYKSYLNIIKIARQCIAN